MNNFFVIRTYNMIYAKKREADFEYCLPQSSN